ncbi:glycerate kinase family protein [Pelagibius litoralis]|nr:glycerate kinase [Pelagibius litoralis]
MRVLIAPSGFKEGLSAPQAADCIEHGVLTAMPDAQITKIPMVDGGEGFTRGLVAITGGTLHHARVTGPVVDMVDAHFGFLGGSDRKTAVIEMAAAAGLRLVPKDRRDPRHTTSFGVGELISHALDAGAERIIVGCGDSGINDGGAGMAQALGVRLIDDCGQHLGPGGSELARLHHIDLSDRDPRLDGVRIDAAVNWKNVLLGRRGVARVFGPQKGATPAQVEELERSLETYAALIRRDVGPDIGREPGCGASGGLGAGLKALIGARLHPRYDIVMQYFDIERQLRKVDLVLTAEGRLDDQTPYGKVPVEVATRAKRHGVPVIVLAGSIGKGAYTNLNHGIDAYASIIKAPCSLDEAMVSGCKLLTHAAEHAVRMVGIGAGLSDQATALAATG